MSRSSAAVTGLVGLLGATVLTTFCIFIVVWEWLPVVLTQPLLVGGLFLFLVVFSLAEIPVMIFGIRHLAASTHPGSKYLALLTNTGYVSFGAVYAAPFILLTGRLWLGTMMAGLSVIRFISAIIFLPR